MQRDGGFMDLMDIRRQMMGVIAGMAGGADYVSGTFTVPNSVTSYTLDFGKTFSKYLYLVEMTDESKTALKNSDIDAARAFGYVGIYPNLSINNVDYTSNSMYARYKPTTNSVSGGNLSASSYTNSSITFPVNSVATSITPLYNGYSYNYFIVEIK